MRKRSSLPLAAVDGGRWSRGAFVLLACVCAHSQLLLEWLRIGSWFDDAASRSKHNLAPGVRRYDIFNVRLQCATFSDSGLQYRVGELGGGGGGGETRVYRGPSLASLQGWQRRVDGSAWPQLLLLEAPGVLEVWFT